MRWSVFNWTWPEFVWVLAVAVFLGSLALLLALEWLGLKGYPFPGIDGARFIPLTWPVEMNIERRAWVAWVVRIFVIVSLIFYVWLDGHWFDWWPWESSRPQPTHGGIR